MLDKHLVRLSQIDEGMYLDPDSCFFCPDDSLNHSQTLHTVIGSVLLLATISVTPVTVWQGLIAVWQQDKASSSKILLLVLSCWPSAGLCQVSDPKNPHMKDRLIEIAPKVAQSMGSNLSLNEVNTLPRDQLQWMWTPEQSSLTTCVLQLIKARKISGPIC